MKKLYFILGLLVASFFSFAQEADPNAPEIKFDKESIEYGTIKQDESGVRVFEFTNTGKSPLIITSATGSCGCTVPTYPKEPIMPGQKSKIEVRYDTHRIGSFNKNVTVNSNAKNGTVTLRISGTVEANNSSPTNNNTPPVFVPTPVPNPTPVTTTAPTKTTTTPVKTTTTPTKTTTPVKKTTTTPTKTTTPVKKTTTTPTKTTTPVKKTTTTPTKTTTK